MPHSFEGDMDRVWSGITGDHGKQPSERYLGVIVAFLAGLGVVTVLYFKTSSAASIRSLIRDFGVHLNKITRTAMEIERKMFHLAGLGVPCLYQLLMENYQWTQADFCHFCWVVTAVVWSLDIFRVYVPNSLEHFPFSLLRRIIREREKNQLSGTCYFSLGCTLAITVFPPAVSIVSIMWLVLGDMSAALIGVSIGGDMCVVKMGREGKKSLEGSVAMFIVCLLVGLVAFGEVYLHEYAVVLGALVATLVELYEPFGINDNLTIPVTSSLALQWGLSRIESC